MSTTNNESSARNKVQALLAEAIAIVEKMSSEEREAFRTSKTIREEPIDICERLDKDGFAVEVVAEGLEADGHEEFSVALRETAALEREAAAAIRRLRAAIDECLEAAGIPVGQAEHYVTVPALIADKIGDMEDYAAIRYRAGIEAAARHLAATKVTEHLADEVRALADKPAPDLLRPGLEYIAKKIDEHRYAFRSEVSAAEAHKAAGIEYSTLVHREIAARKGG